MIRIFTAFPIRNESADSFLNLSKKNSNFENIRWTPKENLHITLFFIGEVEEFNLDKIKKKLAEVLRSQHSFLLSFEKGSFAGSRKRSSMIWGQFKMSGEFRMLSEKIHESVKEFMTIGNVHKDPIPHCTLARIKPGADISPIDLRIDLPEGFILKIDSAELWQTVQTKEGVRYKDIENFLFNSK